MGHAQRIVMGTGGGAPIGEVPERALQSSLSVRKSRDAKRYSSLNVEASQRIWSETGYLANDVDRA